MSIQIDVRGIWASLPRTWIQVARHRFLCEGMLQNIYQGICRRFYDIVSKRTAGCCEVPVFGGYERSVRGRFGAVWDRFGGVCADWALQNIYYNQADPPTFYILIPKLINETCTYFTK